MDRPVVYGAITRRTVLFTLNNVGALAAARPIVLGVLEVRGGAATSVRRLLGVARREAARHGGTHAIIIVIGKEAFLTASFKATGPWSGAQRERMTLALLVLRNRSRTGAMARRRAFCSAGQARGVSGGFQRSGSS